MDSERNFEPDPGLHVPRSIFQGHFGKISSLFLVHGSWAGPIGRAHGSAHGPGPWAGGRAQAKHDFLPLDINIKDAQRPYDPFAGGIAPRSLLCVRK